MSFWKKIIYHQGSLFKALLFLSSSLFVLWLFPKGINFQYEYQQGLLWQHENYFAPFDFPIQKTADELSAEREEIERNTDVYYRYNSKIVVEVQQQYQEKFNTYFPELRPQERTALFAFGQDVLNTIYTVGVLPLNWDFGSQKNISLIRGNTEQSVIASDFIRLENLRQFLSEQVAPPFDAYLDAFYGLFFELLEPNVSFDKTFSNEVLQRALEELLPTRGIVPQGTLIISKGELVDEAKVILLSSIEQEYDIRGGSNDNSLRLLVGYAILIGLSLFFLFRFLFTYRPKVYRNNKEVTFVVLNIVLMLALTISVVNYNEALVYAVPLCILPLTLKAFFDPRLGLLSHVITILLLGFVVPNSYEFIFIQFNAGIITLQSNAKLHHRASLFLSVGQIFLVYVLSYLAFTIIHNTQFTLPDFQVLGYFFINVLLTLFVQPLIYLFERLFVLTSDVSLLELSDTNSPLLKELSDKAPGTFHHSLQVANLAEAATNAIGANSLLVRVGALYHDIGKIQQPSYFSENQKGTVSPHNDLTPKQSAQLIIAHVKEGVGLAKKYNLPERIIDFIRTHHGTSTVYYFYKKAQDQGEASKTDFQYAGPKPFSKETAILMMADAVEAASKSLRAPNLPEIEAFVAQIIARQMEEGQFNACAITLQEIAQVQSVLIDKLRNIYQLRVEYPK